MKKVALGIGLLAGGVAAVLVLMLVEFEPKTPAEALDRAEKRLAAFYKMSGLDEAGTVKEQDKALDRFRIVGKRWPGVPEVAKADARVADLLRSWKRLDEAL